MRSLVTLLAAGLVLASCEPPSGDHTTTPAQAVDPGTLRQPIDPYACSGTDQTPPRIVITSPSSGSALSGTVTLTVNATDDVGVTRVNFSLDGRLLLSDNTPPFELVWDSATHGNGPGVFTAEAGDANCNWTTSAPVDVTIDNAGNATYDATWAAPACAAVGLKCDSADLLEGRGGISPELHYPNTVGNSCEDGSIGVGGPTAAVQRLVVSRSDGTALAAGKEVTVQATVQATASYAYQALDLYSAPDASNPTWTFVATLFPPNAVGIWTLSTKYVLPAGGRQVLRGVFRGNGRQTPPSPCIPSDHFTNPSTDHDDLVFAVGQETDSTPPAVAITSPVEGATLERVVTVGVAASDNFGVHRVELYDGGTLVATSAYSPSAYSLSWATRTVPNGLHTLTARAYDLAGNVSTSVSVNVLIDNDYVAPQVALITPVEGATVNQMVSLEASASDDRSVARVDFHADGVLIGSRSYPPYTVSWNTRWGVSNGAHVLRATAYDLGGNASPPSTVNVLVDNDFVSPQTALTSPASGAALSGTVTLEASASDDRGIAEVSFFVDYSLIGTDTTPPYSISWDSAGVSNGSHKLSTLARDVGGNSTSSAAVTVEVNNPGNARFDTDLLVPRCDSVAASCDTRELVWSRGRMLQGEPNTPNTLNGCADGSSGKYHYDESLDRLRVIREDGTPLAAGKRVRIEADVWAYSTYNSLHLFYTADAKRSPTWTYLTSVKPTGTGAQTLSAEYVLPAGGLQAVRAVFGNGPSSLGVTCTTSTYDFTDRDDLVFPVGLQETDIVPPDEVVLTAPAPGETVTGPLTLTASASDNLGVVAVDFFDGETLIGTDTQPPYSVSWNSRNGPNGSRTLTVRARDAAGNEGISAPVTVTAANDLSVPVVSLTAPTSGSRLSRVVEFAADATDPEGVTRVEFYVNTRLVGSDTSAPFSCQCDTMISSADNASLTARAYDAAGNVGVSAPVVATIVSELVPPSVSLTAPVGGVTLVGTVMLSANASDGSGVSRVEFFLDGVRLGTDTSAPYSYAWNTLTAANGGHILSARATDLYGNVATSTEVSVTVDNAAPSVALTSPASGAVVVDRVSIQADATDNQGVTRVDFFVDGVLLASDTTAPYGVEWDSGLWFNGNHTLLAKAHDTANNVASSTQVTVSTDQPGSAVFDSYYLRVPKCATLSTVCDTTGYVKGRHTGESYGGPGTINSACADGTGSLNAQKINRLKLSSVDGEHFTQGGRVRIEVHVRALDTTTDALDLFYASDANNPAWAYLITLQPGTTGEQVLSTEYVLPSGKLQAVRAQLRVGGDNGSACSTGTLDDHDDVVFAVDSGPAVVLTAPSSNAQVRGMVPVTATATDDQGVAKVEFYVDGTLLGTDTSAPYELSWDSAAVADGAHSLTARAYDTAGLASTSTAVVVYTDNTPPAAALTSPAQGVFLRGIAMLEATASDNQAVSKVEFYAGSTRIGTASTAPYVLSWSTTGVTSGAHTLTVNAYDSVGNVGTSAGVAVTVDNTAPTTALSAPAQNALVRGTVQVSATASDTGGVAKVEFYADGTLIGTDTSAPYGVNWDSAAVVDGAHSLTAKAYDTAGNVRTSTAVVVNTDNALPDAALTSPGPGTFLRGTAVLEATASDTGGVARVEFYRGTTLLGSDTTAPYAMSWNTVGVADGAHALSVKAYDSIGNVGTSAGVAVTVDNTAPTTALSTPAQNALVRGSVPVSATASDTGGVERVEFYAGGTLLGTATTAPYVVSWDTTGWADGGVTLTTRAYDLAGNVTVSAGRVVSVDNAAPGVAITSPANGATLFLSATLQASASDNVGVTQVVFYDGGTVIGTDTTAPYSVSWNLVGVSKGTHTLTAKAHDAAGNVTTSAPISVKVN
jgi:hypothetical protein